MSTSTLTNHAVDPYWSRTDGACELASRPDPVIWSDDWRTTGEFALDEGTLRDYESKGFLADAARFSEQEAGEMLTEAERMAAAITEAKPGVVFEPERRVVRSIFRVHQTNELFRRVAEDPRLVDVARQLLGSDVYVHQSRINFKPAFDGKEFFWHSDFETWHIEDGMPRMRAVSVSISLSGLHEFNGPLMVVPGSHKTYVRCVGATPKDHFQQSLQKQEYGVPSQEAMKRLVDDGGIVAPKGPPGMTLFFECNLMHGSSGNLSPDPRTNLFLVYNSVENAPVDPFGGTPPRPEFLSERHPTPIK